MMRASHDAISNWYDFFGHVCSGGRIYESQVSLIPHLPKRCEHILIPGCGNGKFLIPLLENITFSSLTIIDSSAIMIENAKQNSLNWEHQIKYIHAEFNTNELDQDYDLICAPYFLDLFEDSLCTEMVFDLYSLLKPGGLFLCSDFDLTSGIHNRPFWSKIYIRFLYEVFFLTTGMLTKDLPRVFENFDKLGMDLVAEDYFMCSIIHSAIYKKDLPLI